MHKDRKVAAIREDGTCTIYSPSFVPYNLHLEKAESGDLDTRLNNLNSFYYWCSSRVLPRNRKYAKEVLNCIGANPEWFEDAATREMFFRRLAVVKNTEN